MKGLCVISNRHPDIMVVFVDVYLGWSEPNAYHQICMCHLAIKFMIRFKDMFETSFMQSLLKNQGKKVEHAYGHNWLEAIPLEKWALSHDGG